MMFVLAPGRPRDNMRFFHRRRSILTIPGRYVRAIGALMPTRHNFENNAKKAILSIVLSPLLAFILWKDCE